MLAISTLARLQVVFNYIELVHKSLETFALFAHKFSFVNEVKISKLCFPSSNDEYESLSLCTVARFQENLY